MGPAGTCYSSHRLAFLIGHGAPNVNTPTPETSLPARPRTVTVSEPRPMPDDEDKPGDAKWTGILFVHGMGSQRRYGDVSALVEALDQRAREGAEGRFVGIDVKLEPATRDNAPPVAYLEAKWEDAVEQERTWPQFRFYEAYWAPVTAGGVPRREVIKWLFAQVAKPLGGFATSWRDKARLRRAVLQGLKGVADNDVGTLFRAYDDYEGPAARRDYGQQRFRDFEKFLKAGGEGGRIPQGRRDDIIAVARRWHRACVWAEVRNLFVLVTLAVALLAVTGLIVLTAAAVLALREGESLRGFSPLDLARYIKDHKETFTMLGGTALLVPGLASGLSEYLGDVVFWTTYEETQTRYEKRRQILAEVRSYVSHLTNHPNCERIVVVAHSLGTAIAVDAILAEARDARALQGDEHTRQLLNHRKITHVVTYGSPIDKIHYFFERDPEQHRYHRVVEDLRGDIGTEPFGNQNGRAWVHWINFWDRADFISGTLESPANRTHPRLRVDNVEVSSGPFLNPLQAHTGYLNPRRPAVIDALLDVILHKSTEHRGPDGITYRGPGSAGKGARLQLVGAIAVVWLLAVGLAICIATVSIGWAAIITASLAGLVVFATVIAAGRTLITRLGLAVESALALIRR